MKISCIDLYLLAHHIKCIDIIGVAKEIILHLCFSRHKVASAIKILLRKFKFEDVNFG